MDTKGFAHLLVIKGIDLKSSSFDMKCFSTGELQRFSVARALSLDCDIIRLDEALNSLDYESETDIINMIRDHYPSKALLYVSHRKKTRFFI